MRVAVIGAGPAGLTAGYELLEQGFSDFTIFEASDGVGGTWHVQDYPGLACDVWAHSYTFSWEPNPDWTASFVDQPEIEAYLQDCATRFGLDPHIRLNTPVKRARYEAAGHWQVETGDGETHEFDIVINAMGNQHTALYPDVPGLDSFAGASWHSTEWNHDFDLTGKRVAVVGSAASAVQIVPEIARQAGYLAVLQRSANWIMPRGRKVYSDAQRRRFKRFPFLINWTRKIQRLMMGQVQPAVTHGHKRMEQFEARVKKFIDTAVDDPVVREQLVPDSRYGCRRGLVSDDFYPALNRDNVELIASGLSQVTETGLVTSDGRTVDVDVIIYCTGYRILDFDRIEITGASGETLAARMARGAHALKGISVSDFPNYFFAVGPNGLVLNAPYFNAAETNLETVVRLLREMQAQGARSIEVREEVLDAYVDWMAPRFDQFSWGSSDCNSYYRDASGHAPFLFPGDFKTYQRLHDESGLHEYKVVGAS